MAKPRDYRQKDLLRPALEEIIDLGHPLVRLAVRDRLGVSRPAVCRTVCTAGAGQPRLPTRLVAGLLILEHMHGLVDEALCARWLENPYYQFFCGELSFCHQLPFDRSSLTRWRQRLGEDHSRPCSRRAVGRAQDRRSGDPGSRAGGGRHHGAAEGDRPSDRRPVVPPGAGEAGRAARRNECSCARATAGWPSAPRSWSGATPTRTSSSALAGR